ncbi:hypothetical protein [Peribacillus simplex]|uniref:hypothetical protein n=1 Tax=Peribacillus simplex TaxID=1478 RepID=UPI003D2A472A
MSLASYIGCNLEIPLSNEESDDLIIIGDYFSNEYNRRDVKKHQFTTPFIYEVSSDWGIEISDYMNPKTCAESKEKLIELCKIIDSYIDNGDYFELYSCWVGEEADKREGEIILRINNLDIEQIKIPEKTLVRFEK